jgi:ABC-2 type transport system ATP-binding protein
MTDFPLVLEGVEKSFGNVRAVAGLDLRVPAGCIYGFLGPNGSGKTTTLRMIMDIIRPDGGSLSVLGNSSIAHSKDRVGYMPEERGLYGDMRVGKMVGYIALLKGLRPAEATAATDDWLARAELSSWADRKVHDLSRGMQQRLQFVAAVMHGPELLILDEPFSGLDPVNLDLIKGFVMELRDRGVTILLSTHMMEQAESLCDFVLLINSGAKLLDGSLDEIRASHRTEAIVVEMDGEAESIADLEGVSAIETCGRSLRLILREGVDDREVLRALLDRTRVRSFGLEEPSLHDIFVKAVGGAG